MCLFFTHFLYIYIYFFFIHIHNTDVLLCHDDELESRRIAYVLYLVDGGEEGWCESDGGLLDLFENTGIIC